MKAKGMKVKTMRVHMLFCDPVAKRLDWLMKLRGFDNRTQLIETLIREDFERHKGELLKQ